MIASRPLYIRNGLRRSVTLLATLMAFGGAGAGVYAGLSLIASEADGASGSFAPRTTVSVMTVDLQQSYNVTRRFTGQIEATARTDLGFELGGRIIEVLAEEGDVVPVGHVLARLDVSALLPERAALEAELAAVAADAELARLTLERNDALTERGFRSIAAQDEARLGLARAEASMAALRARIAGVDVRLEKSVLVAPFAARIGARLADAGQTAAAGQTVVVLFEAEPPRARVGVPPDIAASLSPGDQLWIELNGSLVETTLRQIRPDLDPATRSRTILLDLPETVTPVLGDTLQLVLQQEIREQGFWAPLSSLREGARGSWSVLAVAATAEGDRILPAAVEVIHTDGARVFLRGSLPPGARIVAEAPDRVAPGQLVLAQAE